MYKLKALTESPLTSSSLPISISTLYVDLSRQLRVGQYFFLCRSVLVRQRGSDIIKSKELRSKSFGNLNIIPLDNRWFGGVTDLHNSRTQLHLYLPRFVLVQVS